MSIYDAWADDISNKTYASRFISSCEETVTPLVSGTSDDITTALSVLNRLPLNFFLDIVCQLPNCTHVGSHDVPQFSSLEAGVERIPELLLFSESGYTFYELGYQLVKAKHKGANVKYGENHSNLAQFMSLAQISKTSPRKVTSTSLGRELVSYSLSEKQETLKKLLLRNKLLQLLLKKSTTSSISYFDVVSFLAPSTATRRRSNTKSLMAFILSGTTYESCLYNINWWE